METCNKNLTKNETGKVTDLPIKANQSSVSYGCYSGIYKLVKTPEDWWSRHLTR